MRNRHHMQPDVTTSRQTRIRGMQNNEPTPSVIMQTIPDPAQVPTLTVDTVAKFLHVSRASAYQAVHSGEIPSIRVGRRILVPTAALLALLGLDGGRCALPQDGEVDR